MIPALDGLVRLQRVESELRRVDDPVLSRLPVVAVTAFGREHSRDRVLAGGFVEHLQKPVEPETLCRIIGRAAGR